MKKIILNLKHWNFKDFVFCTLIILFVLFTGCTSFYHNRDFTTDKRFREWYIKEHPNLPEDIKCGIAEGKIVPGMDKKTVSELLGLPKKTYIYENGLMEIWYYEKYYVGFDKTEKVVKFGNF